MSLLDKFKKGMEVAKTNRDASNERLNAANAELEKVNSVDKALKERFVGRVLRGKLIDDVSVIVSQDGDEYVRFTGRLLTVDEFLSNSYKEVVDNDDWVSGALSVYGGKVDRKYWDGFVGRLSSYGVAMDDSNVSSSRLLVASDISGTIKSYSFTSSEIELLKNVLVGELDINLYPIPNFSGFVDRDLLNKSFDKVISFIIEEDEKNSAVKKRWLYFFDGGKDEFVNEVVSRAATAVEDISFGK